MTKKPIFTYLAALTILALLILTLSRNITASAYFPLDQQQAASAIANQARLIGLQESDPIITRSQELWWQAQNEFNYDRDLIATAIYHEAWGGCSDRHRELVGAVIYNRTNSPVWPDTVYEVLTSPGQYAKDMTAEKNRNKAMADPEIWAHCQSIAEKVLRGEVDCPEDVVYQSNTKQGKVYEVHETSYSVSYFCYGRA
jgi:spore germination cell wall hydrolase CwlJ-like protein